MCSEARYISRGANPAWKHDIGGFSVSALHGAAHIGHIQIAELLLDHGWDLDVVDTGGGRPLHLAAMKGHVQMNTKTSSMQQQQIPLPALRRKYLKVPRRTSDWIVVRITSMRHRSKIPALWRWAKACPCPTTRRDRSVSSLVSHRILCRCAQITWFQ